MQKKTLSDYYSDLQENIKNNNFEECVKLLTVAITEYPKEYKLKLNLGNVYKVLGQVNNASNVYTELLTTTLKMYN